MPGDLSKVFDRSFLKNFEVQSLVLNHPVDDLNQAVDGFTSSRFEPIIELETEQSRPETRLSDLLSPLPANVFRNDSDTGDPRVLDLQTRPNVVKEGTDKLGDDQVKGLFFVRRKEGLSVDEFQSYWAEQHAPLVLRTPGLDRYVQHHTDENEYRKGPAPAYDGVGELRWSNRSTFLESWSSPEIQDEQFRDSTNFLDTDQVVATLVSEQVVTGYSGRAFDE